MTKEIDTIITKNNNSKCKSLRSSIPPEFIKLYDLNQGDILRWCLVEENGERWLKVVPMRPSTIKL